MKIVTTKSENSSILRQTMPEFDFSARSPKEIKDTVKEMRKIMKLDGGVGLSANQVGLDWRMFVAQHKNNFYAIFNPVITKFSKEQIIMEEGCLSLPEVFKEIKRPEAIVIEGYDQNGKKLKIKAGGTMARIFQHEFDHLNGKLIIDF